MESTRQCPACLQRGSVVQGMSGSGRSPAVVYNTRSPECLYTSRPVLRTRISISSLSPRRQSSPILGLFPQSTRQIRRSRGGKRGRPYAGPEEAPRVGDHSLLLGVVNSSVGPMDDMLTGRFAAPVRLETVLDKVRTASCRTIGLAADLREHLGGLGPKPGSASSAPSTFPDTPA